jgi:hypothetical protein
MQIEPSLPFGDAPCPNCGTLLLFVQLGRYALFVTGEESEAMRERIRTFWQDDDMIREETIRQIQSVLAKQGADSLDIVELVMELEEDFE